MKTKPKKTVTAWVYSCGKGGKAFVCKSETRLKAMNNRSWWRDSGFRCGPIVKIALPLPKEKKR